MAVVLGNVALRFIPVSFSEAIGATTPAWTAVIAFLLLNTIESAVVYATLLPVILGIVMAVGGEPSFHVVGLFAAFASTACRALKSVLQGVLLSTDEDRMDALNLLHWMSIVAVIVLLPTALLLEPGLAADLQKESYVFHAGLLFNSMLAYFVNLTNFLVTRHTSALTLQVLGNAKGVLMVIISIALFHNEVSVIGMLGYAIAVFGVATYAYAKQTTKPSAR
ncbi:hypothetical protein WJX72_011263 [[Myrmecia] bisecta]|uniref:Sugar phosphate transporter domain-containing protein n=1 Tax=[Myrmecia] bisecta TaxID=41462 RepID=A0AAW1QSW2_9CHLO